ncbi:Release factor glutamine methyltransferase [Choanephora cucurbitarum]|uniref:peptide chain release factor N(5)-glutamine methyltransferase n=1 Tax=Choanephora cucurbitarum TaxID=101091 RepID=A0A1C7NUM1_9FUNG|nr:Release factor glutamine methyltransferase [Choanephora cucurbitarum]
MRSKIVSQQAKWIKLLSAACEGDIGHAKRQLFWLKEKVVPDSHRRMTNDLLDQEVDLLDQYVHEHVHHHKPLQYILGTQPFCELDILTRPPTLIPRWETEEWTYKVIDLIKQHDISAMKRPLHILDICTGSGCIALALAKHLPESTVHVTGLDISKRAISLAEENLDLHRHELQNSVEFKHQDVFHYPIEETTVDLIVSNPPYVTQEEYAKLDPNVKDWEDIRALVAEEQGTRVHQRIIDLASAIKPSFSPFLFMEIGGTHQVSLLKQMMKDKGIKKSTVWKDLAGQDRVVVGY